GGSGGAGGSPPVDCSADDACGVPPPVEGTSCWDGSVAGFICVLGDDGICGFVDEPCPPEGDLCALPLVVGPCEAAIPSWGYDGAQGGCVAFTYGGCGGNANRFDTLEACQAACGAGGDVACGGRAGNPCTANEYCEFSAQSSCGFDDGQGFCRPRPEVCPEIYGPVCGCDGQTYDNACFAAGAGTDVLFEGVCEGPPPLACDDLSRDSIVLGGELSYGECLEGCRSTLVIAATSLNRAPPCDEVVLTVCDNDPGAPCTEHRGILTPDAHAQARTAARALVGVNLMEVYGCPDCADRGARTLELVRDGVSSTHRYEAAQAPVELSDADALVRALIQDLRACESSHVVDVLPGCMPR
ncbi:MAG: BPTI/Kunitz-type proteinase inhibitor domain-containing protein, partial [Bradymonadia bacterium]